jgi:predicted amidohydrolase
MSERTTGKRRPTTIRVAAVQMDVKLGENKANLDRILTRLEEAAANGAQLVVFPECATSGYCFTSLEEATPHTTVMNSHYLEAFHETCFNLGVTGILGYLEQLETGCYNSALVAFGEEVATYRKTHLPTLGVDRFVKSGEYLFATDVPFGKLGILICYDIRFPEAARVLALNGADIIALPTNWPEGAESAPDFLTRARAWENRVFIVAANRVGMERGRRFIGRSQIVAPSGEILREAGPEEETILYADLDLSKARQKRIIIEPGEWELDVIGGRRPELYGRLTEK